MKTKIEKQPKSTVKLNIIIEKEIVQKVYNKILDEAVKTTQVEGFRKGMAPKEMVENKIGKNNLYSDVINEVLKTYYPQALKENKISPVSNPKIEIKEFDLEKDLEFTALVATMPDIELGDYMKALEKYYKDKSASAKAAADKEDRVHLGTNEVVDVLVKEAKIEIADLLIEEETDRLLSKFMDQIQKIGLTLDKYLQSQEKKPEQLRKDYEKIAINNLKAEFVLSELIKKENIEVADKEIDETINAVADPKAKERLNEPMQRLYIKSVLQKNKVLQNIIEKIEGGKKNE